MIRCLLTFVGLLFAGSTGAFLLYVPTFSVLTVALLMCGVLANFLLGVYVGYGQVPPIGENLRTSASPENSEDWEDSDVGKFNHAA